MQLKVSSILNILAVTGFGVFLARVHVHIYELLLFLCEIHSEIRHDKEIFVGFAPFEDEAPAIYEKRNYYFRGEGWKVKTVVVLRR